MLDKNPAVLVAKRFDDKYFCFINFLEPAVVASPDDTNRTDVITVLVSAIGAIGGLILVVFVVFMIGRKR